MPHSYFMGFGHRNITIFVMVGVFGFLLGSFGIISPNTDNSLKTDSVMALGHLELVLKDADGNIKQYMQTDNLIVNEGTNTMADLIFPGVDFNNNVTDTKFDVIGIGEGTTAAAESDVSLETLISGCSNQTASTGIENLANLASNQGAEVVIFISFSGGSPFGCSGTITEAILQNDIAGKGEVLSHQVFSPGIILGDNDSLFVDWFIELG